MLTNSEIRKLIDVLMDARGKLLWLIGQEPINEKQKEFIEGAWELLKRVNQMLNDFNVGLPG